MMIRAIITIATHSTVAMLLWAAYSYHVEGIGLHPLIALPGALILYAWNWLWLLYEAHENDCNIEDYLEWLDSREDALYENKDMQDDTRESAVLQIHKSRNWWVYM